MSFVFIKKCQKNGLFVLDYGNRLEVREFTEGPPVCLGIDVEHDLCEL